MEQYNEMNIFIDQLANSIHTSIENQYQIVKDWLRSGRYLVGEDFYAGQSEKAEIANEIINNLIDGGYFRFKDPDYPEADIVLNEKAKSKSQQKFMGIVHAAQKGDLKNPSPAIKKVAKSMKKKDVKDFASTKHKGLPKKVKKTKEIEETVQNVVFNENNTRAKMVNEKEFHPLVGQSGYEPEY